MNNGMCIGHREMDAAIRGGRAVPLGASVPWLTRYRAAWWVVIEGGWLRIDDGLTADDLDSASARLSTSAGRGGR
jgi:hypothetical protein